MEKEIIKDLNIAAYYMSDIDDLGIEAVVEEALTRVDPEGGRRIHLSFDIAALDPAEAPATGTPVRGGLTLREGMKLCQLLSLTGKLRAMDLVEVNPSLATDKKEADRTVSAANNIVLAALGFRDSSPL